MNFRVGQYSGVSPLTGKKSKAKITTTIKDRVPFFHAVEIAPEENCSPVKAVVWVKVRVTVRVGGQSDNCRPPPPVRLRGWVSVSFGLGAIFLWGNCPRTLY